MHRMTSSSSSSSSWPINHPVMGHTSQCRCPFVHPLINSMGQHDPIFDSHTHTPTMLPKRLLVSTKQARRPSLFLFSSFFSHCSFYSFLNFHDPHTLLFFLLLSPPVYSAPRSPSFFSRKKKRCVDVMCMLYCRRQYRRQERLCVPACAVDGHANEIEKSQPIGGRTVSMPVGSGTWHTSHYMTYVRCTWQEADVYVEEHNWSKKWHPKKKDSSYSSMITLAQAIVMCVNNVLSFIQFSFAFVQFVCMLTQLTHHHHHHHHHHHP